jgi:hypothetical protein
MKDTTQLMKHPFRHPSIWISFGWLLVVAVVYLSVARHGVEIPGRYGDKYGHVIAYGTVMFWFMQIYHGARSRFLTACALLTMGIGLEFVQAWLGYRAFERADMVADAIGVALGWLAGPPRTPNALELIERRL